MVVGASIEHIFFVPNNIITVVSVVYPKVGCGIVSQIQSLSHVKICSSILSILYTMTYQITLH